MESLILDNPVFNVKGEGKAMLLVALELGINCVGHSKFSGFRLDATKGIVLYWTDSTTDGYHQFMSPSKPEDIVDQVFQAVTDTPINIINDEDDEYWDKPCDDDDVGNDLGWRLYTEQWGHIGDEWEACLAIIPSYLWVGK